MVVLSAFMTGGVNANHVAHTQSENATLPPCTCRAEGRIFDLGEFACLQTPNGPRIAVLDIDQTLVLETHRKLLPERKAKRKRRLAASGGNQLRQAWRGFGPG